MKIISRGDLGHRLTLSSNRLECEHYRPDVIWTRDKNAWPGDWEGRTILALVSLYRATGKEPAYLEGILNLIPSKLNKLGYIGEVYENGEVSEQQIAGNSWFLSALIEYENLTKNGRFTDTIKTMVKNLYLPLSKKILDYPTEKVDLHGNYSGSIVTVQNGWKLSTDIGCVFISLDGISRAYQLLKTPELSELLKVMIDIFFKNDVLALDYQTHATLSAIRGVLRYCAVSGDITYLSKAKERFSVYLENGMTENYENRNKFFTNEWTEPCAIIDSYMCCVELFKLTKDSFYIDLAHRIYYNAICRTQLPNGGFGLDTCVGHDGQKVLKNIKNNAGKPTEAYWCCTMRGADGLSYVSENQCQKTDKGYCFIQYFDSKIIDGNIEINEITQLPYYGKTKFVIKNQSNKEIEVKLYKPDYAKNISVLLNGNAYNFVSDGNFILININDSNCTIDFRFDIEIEKRTALTKDFKNEYFTYNHGCLLLGADAEFGDFIPNDLTYDKNADYFCNNIKFSPFSNTIDYDFDNGTSKEISFLFK